MEGEGTPKGGFVFVSATGLLATWWSYNAGLIEFRDVRAWLACHEVKARRCTLEKGRAPRFTEGEVGRLVGGVGGEHVRASLRRLARASLLSWSESCIEFRVAAEGLPADAIAFVESVANHRRRIPVPRPLLRFLARERKPVLVATAIGHLLRCMYFRKGRCEPKGLCKASWIADTLGVDERNVKSARQALEAVGILERLPTPQLVMNRYGVAMRLNLGWSCPKSQSPRPIPVSTTESPRPKETGISSFGRSEHQKLAGPSLTGVRKRTRTGPDIFHVREGDLKDPRMTLSLYGELRREGLVGSSESERLKIFAVAEHAKAYGKRNIPGLFMTIIRRGLWGHLTQSDEDKARRALYLAQERDLAPTQASTERRRESREEIRRLIASSLGLAEAPDASLPFSTLCRPSTMFRDADDASEA